eukprot:m.108537 g.108537  ORF g.108537 m.108537 type:complete len:187 (-) comp15213_c1_seq4:775-1335(-)
MERRTQMPLWLAVMAALVACVNTAPVLFIMDHQNIIMTLHGLIDHVDVPDVLAEDRTAARERYQLFYDSTIEQTNTSASAYANMDLNRNQRLMLSEAVLWALAAADVMENQAKQMADFEFDRIGTMALHHSCSTADVGGNRIQISVSIDISSYDAHRVFAVHSYGLHAILFFHPSWLTLFPYCMPR